MEQLQVKQEQYRCHKKEKTQTPRKWVAFLCCISITESFPGELDDKESPCIIIFY